MVDKEQPKNRIYALELRGGEFRHLEVLAAHAVWTEHDLFLADETGHTVFWAPSHVVLYCASRDHITHVEAPSEQLRSSADH